ncbi:helix-turn-helix transcriptional regulator [Rappaport israeli]|uniref:helix-turn-helix transcriptional regulator n=1 Tax=Rappaport israeli TaxID=1839807 RepID=UPI0009301BDF|nr:hypothetical protein [Rappaport israeli]
MTIEQYLIDIKSALERSIQRDDDLWTTDDVAAYLKMSKRSVQSIMKHPNFPKAIRLPTGDNGSKPRWIAGEIRQFCKRFKTQ